MFEVFTPQAQSAETYRIQLMTNLELSTFLLPHLGRFVPDASFADASIPTRQRSPALDGDRVTSTEDVAANEWDLLFRAALEVLERVAVERPSPARGPLQAPHGHSLRACLHALEQLRRSVPRPTSFPWFQGQPQTDGAAADARLIVETPGPSCHRRVEGPPWQSVT